jgi:hypothetical protein
MRSLFFTLLALCCAMPCFSQRADVLKAFSKYKIAAAAIDSLNEHYYLHYSFDLKTSIVTEGSEKVYAAQHDLSKPEDARWVLNTVNGGNPSKLDLNTFKKQHAEKIPPPKPDNNSYKIVKDDGKELVISFQYDPASLVSDNEFMGACEITLYFNAEAGRLVKSEAKISESFKIKMFKAEGLHSNVSYQYMEDDKRYLPVKEEVSIVLKLLGREFEMITINEYSNYRKM